MSRHHYICVLLTGMALGLTLSLALNAYRATLTSQQSRLSLYAAHIEQDLNEHRPAVHVGADPQQNRG